jgi:hypothetical protein
VVSDSEKDVSAFLLSYYTLSHQSKVSSIFCSFMAFRLHLAKVLAVIFMAQKDLGHCG